MNAHDEHIAQRGGRPILVVAHERRVRRQHQTVGTTLTPIFASILLLALQRHQAGVLTSQVDQKNLLKGTLGSLRHALQLGHVSREMCPVQLEESVEETTPGRAAVKGQQPLLQKVIVVKQPVDLCTKATANGQADLVMAAADLKSLDVIHNALPTVTKVIDPGSPVA